MIPEYDIVVIGDYFFDQIYTGLPQFPELGREIICEGVTTTGGAMFITAVALHRLGARVGWPAVFGDDTYSNHVYALTQNEGIDMQLCKRIPAPYRRVTTSMPFHGERAFITYADPDPPELAHHWLDSLGKCHFRHLHFGGLMSPEVMRPLVDLAKERGATLSTDCQDSPLLYTACDWKALFAEIDLLMPNKREALALTGQDTLQDALAALLEWCDLVVVKDGAEGVWIGRESAVIHVPSLADMPVIDTTGAGDCFNAGFLFGYVVENADDKRCGQYGNICGGLSVGGVGGATHAPTYDELQAWVARLA